MGLAIAIVVGLAILADHGQSLKPSSGGIIRDSGGIGLGKYVMGDRDVLEFRRKLAI
jgi:hypothetical protein